MCVLSPFRLFDSGLDFAKGFGQVFFGNDHVVFAPESLVVVVTGLGEDGACGQNLVSRKASDIDGIDFAGRHFKPGLHVESGKHTHPFSNAEVQFAADMADVIASVPVAVRDHIFHFARRDDEAAAFLFDQHR